MLDADPAAQSALEAVLDRREETARLRRSRRRWIWGAAALGVALIAVLGARMEKPRGDHIARYSLVDVIYADAARDALIREIADDDTAKALILEINSPGGSLAGSEALYLALREVAEKKPVAAVMTEVAASGGYIASLAADHVTALGGTITGSIGVIFQAPNASGAMEMLGVKMVELKSGPYKAEPSPFQPVDDAKLSPERAIVQDGFDWFVGLVAERRSLTDAQARALADGRVFTGRQAKAAGLIDAVGGEQDALDWLAAKGVDADLEIVDRQLPPEEQSWAQWALGDAGASANAALRGASAGLFVRWRP